MRKTREGKERKKIKELEFKSAFDSRDRILLDKLSPYFQLSKVIFVVE